MFKRKSISLPLVFLVTIFTLFLITKTLKTSSVFAQDEPYPDPIVPCDETRGSEFHSLRPYQASPCFERDDFATYCGNDLVLQDTVTGYFDPRDPDCRQIGDGRYECNFTINRERSLAIDVSNVDFPIAGRTEENVINSQTQSETLEDADKVNEYISWYLNGLIRRAEYSPIDTEENIEDKKKIVDFSGPLNKLLPWSTQVTERVKTIERATKKDDDLNEDGVDENQNRHDQIIGCVHLARIVRCYPSTLLKTEVRISDMINHIPPLAENFDELDDYWVAYNRWKGDSCLHILGLSFCIDNPFKPNYWANLFHYIPLSSTEDRKGELTITTPRVQPASEDMEITNIAVQSTPADLFFAHQEENVELAKLLQQTYRAKGLGDTNSINYGYVDSQDSDHCSLLEIRSNPGDNLFAGEIGLGLSYTVNFSCEFQAEQLEDPIYSPFCSSLMGTCYPISWGCSGGYGPLDCPIGYLCQNYCEEPIQEQSCEKIANIYLSTITKTPQATGVWSRLVAGATSVFKRFFPKMGKDNSPVEAVLDIPAASKVTYSATDESGNSVPLKAVNPSGRLGDSPELYFPHLGSVQEYFIKAIQTALRPKGYGYPILSGESSESTGWVCDGKNFEKLGNISELSQRGREAVMPLLGELTEELVSVYAAAESETGVPCEIIAGIHHIEAGSSPDQDLQSGAPLNGRTLLESAIQAGYELQDKVGGNIDSFENAIKALSRYNGGGNSNCRSNFNCSYATTDVCGYYSACTPSTANSTCHCPPPDPEPGSCRMLCDPLNFAYEFSYNYCPAQEGFDDPYASNYLFSPQNDEMWLLYQYDCTQTRPLIFERPGAFTFALGLYLQETGGL
jgi:hypothetical protein